MRRGESEVTKREDHLPASRVFDVEKFFSRDKRVFRRGSEKRRHGGKYWHGGSRRKTSKRTALVIEDRSVESE